MLLLPPVFEKSAWYPIALLCVPVIFFQNADSHMAVFQKIFPPHRPIVRLFTRISAATSSMASGFVFPIPTPVPVS